LIASSLAYGRVAQIQASVNSILLKMPSPYAFIVDTSSEDVAKIFDGFKHRFTTLQELVLFFEGIKNTIAQFGSLEQCFMEGYQETDRDIFQALFNFSRQLLKASPCRNSLIPDPEKKSAFKRLNLFLRWMIRNDEVDPGGWKGVPPAKLIYPLDTHIHRLSLALGLTKKNQNDYRTSAEITDGFREISPDDPVKYDFSLTSLSIGRPGIDNFIGQHKLLI
jgi:uncharacterized protein (TIGR02757 family)